MRKGAYRSHLRRVSAAPKERRGGVPCTLLVSAWALLLLLLLTSSISQKDQQDQGSQVERPWRSVLWSQRCRQILFGLGDEDMHEDEQCLLDELEDSDSDEHVGRENADHGISHCFAVPAEESVAGGGLLGETGAGGDCRELSLSDDCVSLLLADSDEKLLQSDSSTSSVSRDQEKSSILDSVSLPTRITLHGSVDAIDALQYAEYGAGLLQKRGPAEEGSNVCLIGNFGGRHCQMVGDCGDLAGQIFRRSSGDHKLSSLNEFVGDQVCNAPLSVIGDIVANVEPGEAYLVCRRDLLAESFLCEMVCTTQSECFLSGFDSKPCHYEGSLADLFHLTCPTRPGLGQFEASTTEAGSSLESPDIAEPVALKFSGEIVTEIDVDRLSSVVEVGSKSDLIVLGQPEEQLLGFNEDEENREIRSDGVLLIEDETFQSNIEDPIRQLIDVDLDSLGRNQDKESLSSRVESRFSGGDESIELLLVDDVVRKLWDSDDEPLTLDEVENRSEREPRRLKRVGSLMTLDEYKRSIMEQQQKDGHVVDLNSVQAQKVRHSDESYNYASASHGAKLLASNKEAKGASHILVSDKDKYLRNPCGAEDKYVVMELSEETFVDTFAISNFEFHSANLKDFELLGSPVYPAKEWISLGKFQAENVRHRQKFNIEDPKLVRYLMLRMLTHWGSEFFCTLSGVEVFGVDVIKNFLDDWIALEEVENSARTQGTTGYMVSQEENATVGTSQQAEALERSNLALDLSNIDSLLNTPAIELGSGLEQGVTGGRDAKGKAVDVLHKDEDLKVGTSGDSVQEVVHMPGGKPPGDSVLKILMQRVKALEMNQTLFDLYLGDMNQKYKAMLSELDKDLALVTERLRNETALTVSLAMRLADRELQRKEEKLYMEHQFALIANNFTDTLDFMRWQIQSMERREVAAIVLAMFSMVLSALLHLLARCMKRRAPATEILMQEAGEKVYEKPDNGNISSVCYDSSTFVFYLASGLTILILSV